MLAGLQSPLLDCNMMEVNKEYCPHNSLCYYLQHVTHLHIVPALNILFLSTFQQISFLAEKRNVLVVLGSDCNGSLVQFNKTAVSNVEL